MKSDCELPFNAVLDRFISVGSKRNEAHLKFFTNELIIAKYQSSVAELVLVNVR